MEKKEFLTLCKYILVILAVPIVFKVVEILTSLFSRVVVKYISQKY